MPLPIFAVHIIQRHVLVHGSHVYHMTTAQEDEGIGCNIQV